GGATPRLGQRRDGRQGAMLDHPGDDRIDRNGHELCSRRASGKGKPNSNGMAKPWNHWGRGGKWPTAATISATRLSMSGQPELRRILRSATLPSSRTTNSTTTMPRRPPSSAEDSRL